MPKKEKLLIVESPAKARTITKYLPGDYKVSASVGHIRDLPKSNKNAINIEKGFKPNYQIVSGKESVVKELKTKARGREVLLATDPDREGEAIAWHITEALGLKTTQRVVFHEITETAVQQALKQPRDIDSDLLAAQEARRVLDRLFGYDLSGLIWTKLRYGLSAGRVQSPALRILVEREKEIKNFIPEKYWVLTGVFSLENGEKITCYTTDHLKTEAEAEKAVQLGQTADWRVAKVQSREVKRQPKAPFITSTLQQVASSRLGFSPSQTMRLAQKLYESGHITYMRTDSTTLSEEARKEAISIIKQQFDPKYLSPRTYATKSKNAQEAHEAIRPTKIGSAKAGKTDQEQKLYRLIRNRTIASQMSPATISRSTVVASANKKEVPDLTTRGSRIIFDGWLAFDPEAKGEDVLLPKVSTDDELKLEELSFEGKQTEPPSRFSEAGLVKELEKRGIGRPSTYASIIKTIIDRGYVTKSGRSLQPTDTGEVVSDFLNDHFTKYISDHFTAEMENELDEIATGKRDYVSTLKNFYEPFRETINEKKSLAKITDLGPAPEEFTCPDCGKNMIIKLSKTGRFYSCSDFPNCQGARTETGEVLAGPKETGEDCPECSNGKLVEKEGRFGKFITCNNYPKCRYKKNSEEENNDTGVSCPKCQKGMMTEKRGRFGVFYSCSNYPQCRYAIKSKPTGEHCPICQSLMMEGTKTIPNRCSDKNCPHHRPDKESKKQ